MTGYASAQISLPSAQDAAPAPSARLGLEIRSVNSRFLDLTFKLSDELREFEPMMRECVNAQLKRGKVEVKAALMNVDASPVPEPSIKLLQKLANLDEQVRVWLPRAATLSVADVIKLSTNASLTAPTQELSASVQSLLEDSLAQLLSCREKEGNRLAKAMLERTSELKALCAKVAPLVPQLVEQQRLRFLERWHEALGIVKRESPNTEQQSANPTDAPVSTQLSEDRALNEAANYAIRIDVAEELTRLSSHVSEIETLLSPSKSAPALGKRLDFLIQELHREANTLGSKSTSLELTRIAVDMKVLIEQLREQVQNIE